MGGACSTHGKYKVLVIEPKENIPLSLDERVSLNWSESYRNKIEGRGCHVTWNRGQWRGLADVLVDPGTSAVAVLTFWMGAGDGEMSRRSEGQSVWWGNKKDMDWLEGSQDSSIWWKDYKCESVRKVRNNYFIKGPGVLIIRIMWNYAIWKIWWLWSIKRDRREKRNLRRGKREALYFKGILIIFSPALQVPRQCPLVLIDVRLRQSEALGSK
jgi:hypothetical protein